ncbi:MAG: hypothetical protein ACLPT4_04060 [Verrucomicrobiia bacterium]
MFATIAHLFSKIYSSPYTSPIAGLIAAIGGLILGLRDLRRERNKRAFFELVFAAFWAIQSIIDFSQLKSDAVRYANVTNELAETRNTVVRIDPAKRPIKTVTASARLMLNEVVTNTVIRDIKCFAELYFVPRGKTEDNAFLMVEASEMRMLTNECFINFTWSSPWDALFPPSMFPAEKEIDGVDRCKLTLVSDSVRISEIIRGEATLTVNSFVEKTFTFPPQASSNLMILGFENVTKVHIAKTH